MKGEIDRKRRRAKMNRFSWAKRLMNPFTVRLAVVVVVGITRVITAFYQLYCEFRD